MPRKVQAYSCLLFHKGKLFCSKYAKINTLCQSKKVATNKVDSDFLYPYNIKYYFLIGAGAGTGIGIFIGATEPL